MDQRFHYRLSKNQKNAIAQNLIDILEKDLEITEHTRRFICNWILTGPEEKRKAFFDVWDIVLKNYLPKTRPILFRSCEKIGKSDKITSFTGRLESAKRFSNGSGFLIIFDTNETLEFAEKLYKAGEYKRTFYPLGNVLKKARNSGGWGFTERFLNDFIGEDEYIMRIDQGYSYSLRWI